GGGGGGRGGGGGGGGGRGGGRTRAAPDGADDEPSEQHPAHDPEVDERPQVGVVDGDVPTSSLHRPRVQVVEATDAEAEKRVLAEELKRARIEREAVLHRPRPPDVLSEDRGNPVAGGGLERQRGY